MHPVNIGDFELSTAYQGEHFRFAKIRHRSTDEAHFLTPDEARDWIAWLQLFVQAYEAHLASIDAGEADGDCPPF